MFRQYSNDSATPTTNSANLNGLMETKHSSTTLAPSSLQFASSAPSTTASSSWHQWSAFGTVEETTLSSLNNDEVYRGIHPSFQPHSAAIGNEFNGSSGSGVGGIGTQLFDDSSLWPQQSSTLPTSSKMDLPSLNLTPVTMSSTSSLHAHHASLDDSLDGLIASSAASWTAVAGNKELFVSMTAAVSEPACPPRPIYVERWSSFSVNNVHVFDDIVHHLTTHNIDHSVLPHKIRGVLYPTATLQGSCEFHINRYTGDNDGEWIIEVQRRCGCMFAFKQLYRDIFTLTSSSHINTPSTCDTSSSTSGSGSDMQMSVEASTVKQLTNMASSSSVEVARAGMESLAVLSSISSPAAIACVNIAQTASLPLLDLASRLVATASAATARAAASLIANICVSSPTGVTAAMSCDNMVSSLLNMLDAPSSSSSLPLRDSKRHCARAIAAMATSNVKALQKATAAFDALPTSAFSATAILDRYTNVDDVILRSNVVTALNFLRSSS